MISGNRIIAVRVGSVIESEKSLNICVDESPNRDGFSRQEWFPKKLCKVRKRRLANKGVSHILLCPYWLLEKNKVKINHKIHEE